MKITYNKLVRDKIPDIINAQKGTSCETRILDDSEYLQHLNTKLQEELTEYLESGNVEELADLEEVLRAVLDAKGVSYEELPGTGAAGERSVDCRGRVVFHRRGSGESAGNRQAGPPIRCENHGG